MKKETAKKRIEKGINQRFSNETQEVRDYLVEIAMLTFENLELDYGACHDDGSPYTSSENLEYALDTIDGLCVDEARKETSVSHKPVVGYYGVHFYDDDGNCKNHWLAECQTKFFRERPDAVAYIEEVKSWNAISFTQTVVYKVK